MEFTMAKANERSTLIPSRRAVLAGIATAPALAAPALALSSGAPDPIFAAIERHRAAAEAYTAGVDEQAELETADVPDDDPRWEDFERRFKVIFGQLNKTGRQLFEAPMSIAGLVTLVEYMEEQRRAGNGSWDDTWSLPVHKKMVSLHW
jgi:hypothetical protein